MFGLLVIIFLVHSLGIVNLQGKILANCLYIVPSYWMQLITQIVT